MYNTNVGNASVSKMAAISCRISWNLSNLDLDLTDISTSIDTFKPNFQTKRFYWSYSEESGVVECPSPASCPYAIGAMAVVDARIVPAPAQTIYVPTVCQAREDAV